MLKVDAHQPAGMTVQLFVDGSEYICTRVPLSVCLAMMPSDLLKLKG